MDIRQFENICKMTQEEVIKFNISSLKKAGYSNVIQDDGFIFAQGEIPVLLVAHMDTVHKKSVTKILHFGVTVSSPQGIGGDDRCGIFMINEIIKTHKCHVLFTEDEEMGGIGVSKFIKSPCLEKLSKLNIKYMIELDRKGNNDAVFYECANPDFSDFITGKSGLCEENGSYTDICDLMPELGIAGVNISCGYYNAHQLKEYVNLSEMETQIKKVKGIIEQPCDNPFEFIEAQDYYGYGYYDIPFYAKKNSSKIENDSVYYIEYRSSSKGNKKLMAVEVEARSEAEAIGVLLMDEPMLRYCDVELIYEG